jgi:hypothetical protein
VVPVMYSWLDDLADRLHRWWRKEENV